MQPLLTECVNYFKKKKVYNKLFSALRKKYASLGHMGGIIKLTNLSSDEKNDLEGFFKKDFGAEKDVKISFTLMDKALKSSKFASLAWEEILTTYFNEPLIINKQKREKEANSKNAFFDKCIQNIPTSHISQNIAKWFEDVWKQNSKGSQILIKMYNDDGKDKENTYMFIKKLFIAFSTLPCLENKMLGLPVFAATTTGNPHFFDLNTPTSKLLISFIESLPFINAEIKDIKDTKQISNTEYIENLFYKAGILKDNVSNMCLAYGIHANKKDGSIHEGIEGYYREKEPVQLTLKTLSTLQNIWAGSTYHNTGVEKIYIVENPAVFSYLTDLYPDKTFICGNGQFKLAFYITLELLKDKNLLYYAGDFDADGLLIAQKLKNRYPSQVTLWGYKPKYYNKHISDVELDSLALSKLDKITIPELKQIKECLIEHKRAVYQEAMLEAYVLSDE